MLVTTVLLLTFQKIPLSADYRRIATTPSVRLTRLSEPSSQVIPKIGDYRLYFKRTPTEYFEPKSDMTVRVNTINHRGMNDCYVQSIFSSSGAIIAWNQTYLYWNGNRLIRVPIKNVDTLEFHPDGRLLVIDQFDSWSGVGINELGWEQDRTAYIVFRNKVTRLGNAVNIWFEKDSTIRGISNGKGSKAMPHFFTYQAGIRKDEPTQNTPLKRAGKRLCPVRGSDARY